MANYKNIMYLPQTLKIRSTKTGLGLFTIPPLTKGTLIAKEQGYFIETRDKVSKFCIQISKLLFLDYIHHPHYLDFINHSCMPNMRYDTTHLAFYAVMDIPEHAELTYDYDTTESDLTLDGSDFVCVCDSVKCRKYIAGYSRNSEIN